MLAEIVKMNVEQANITDNEILTEITKLSKSYWGYSKEQILIWSDLLTITEDYIKNNFVFKLVGNSKTIGYYSYSERIDKTIKLDNLFILPEFIGKGFGRFLMDDFLNRIKNNKIKKITLDSEPNAEKFYNKFGFIKMGNVETSIKNRFLPTMELNL